jgi:hypothetical protein
MCSPVRNGKSVGGVRSPTCPTSISSHSNNVLAVSAMVKRLLSPGERGPSATGYELDEGALDAARRVRRISRTITGLPEDVVEVLRACFTLPTPRKLKAFGIGAAVVPNLNVTLEAYGATSDQRPIEDWLARLPRVAGREPALGQAQARTIFAGTEAYWLAVIAYAEGRRRQASWRVGDPMPRRREPKAKQYLADGESDPPRDGAPEMV